MSLAQLSNTLLLIAPCFLLLILTFTDQFKPHAVIRAFIGILIFLVITLFSSSIYFHHIFYVHPVFRSLLELTVILAGVFIFVLTIKYSFFQGVFIIAVAKCYMESVALMVSYVFFLRTGKLPAYTMFSSVVVTAVLVLLSTPLINLFFRKLLRPALDYTASLLTWRLLWIIPVCNNLVYSLVISPNLSEHAVPSGTEFYFVPPLWIFLTFSTYTIILLMMITVSKNAKLEETLHLAEVQINAQQKQTEFFRVRMEETRRIRHDMRHHLLILNGFVEAKDLSGLAAYLRECSALMPVLDQTTYCNSAALNALLCYYKEYGARERVTVGLSVSLPSHLPFSDTDICIIIGNLFENAVEACARMKSQNRFIDLRISMTSSTVLIIIIKNSYEGSIRRAGNFFLSSKAKNRKGIGLSSVMSMVHKYNGISKIEYPQGAPQHMSFEDGQASSDQGYPNPVFKVSILLNARQQNQDADA